MYKFGNLFLITSYFMLFYVLFWLFKRPEANSGRYSFGCSYIVSAIGDCNDVRPYIGLFMRPELSRRNSHSVLLVHCSTNSWLFNFNHSLVYISTLIQHFISIVVRVQSPEKEFSLYLYVVRNKLMTICLLLFFHIFHF